MRSPRIELGPVAREPRHRRQPCASLSPGPVADSSWMWEPCTSLCAHCRWHRRKTCKTPRQLPQLWRPSEDVPRVLHGSSIASRWNKAICTASMYRGDVSAPGSRAGPTRGVACGLRGRGCNCFGWSGKVCLVLDEVLDASRPRAAANIGEAYHTGTLRAWHTAWRTAAAQAERAELQRLREGASEMQTWAHVRMSVSFGLTAHGIVKP